MYFWAISETIYRNLKFLRFLALLSQVESGARPYHDHPVISTALSDVCQGEKKSSRIEPVVTEGDTKSPE